MTALWLGLAVAAGAAQTPPAQTPPAQDASPPPSPIKSLTDRLGITTTPPEPAEFVRKTRPGELDYRPVGVVPPARALKPRTPEQVKSLEAELIATRRRHDAAGHRPPPPVKAQSKTSAKPSAKPSAKTGAKVPAAPR